MNIVGVIPARYASSRFPGKPLADICGKPMIWWVFEKIKKSSLFSTVVVATDDNRIYSVCKELDMNVLMTADNHDTPTSRLYEVSTKIEGDLYLMVMGDEPLIDERSLQLVVPESYTTGLYVGALTNVLTDPPEVVDYTNQKVVTNSKREALFISRSPIPFPKGSLDFQYEKVTGVQIFSKEALQFYSITPKSVLERAEENDLMRFIENGIPVKMTVSPYKTVSVDSYKDLEIVRTILSGSKLAS